MMSQRITLMAGAGLGLTAVLLGAFGAHALEPILVKNGSVETFELAVRYQFYHAIGLLVVGLLRFHLPSKLWSWIAILWVAGVVCFSGSLYTLAFETEITLWWVTPLGGLLLLAGWIALFVAVARKIS
jgi:uncharacterized membrane protein YgdD (TMEM256/DUF423 family)